MIMNSFGNIILIETMKGSLFGNEFEIKLRNEMKQGHIAKECAEWLKNKAKIKSFKRTNTAQPRMIYIENH